MYIELDEVLQKNLIVFMQRVNLTGNEVPEFNKIMAALTRPVEIDIEKNYEGSVENAGK